MIPTLWYSLAAFLLAHVWHGDAPWRPGGGRVHIDADLDGIGTRLDCDDHNADVYPGADEICNGFDDDCDGLVDADDPGLTDAVDWYTDTDSDGLGGDDLAASACEAPDNTVANHDDCDDTDPAVGEAPTWYWDIDRDGYGRDSSTSVSCTAPSAYWVESAGDCDDADDSIYPGAEEVYDDLDNDCDGEIDEGLDTGSDGSDADSTCCPDGTYEVPFDVTYDAGASGSLTVDTFCADSVPFVEGGTYAYCGTYDFSYTASARISYLDPDIYAPAASSDSISSSYSATATVSCIGSSCLGTADVEGTFTLTTLSPSPEDCMEIYWEVYPYGATTAGAEICLDL